MVASGVSKLTLNSPARYLEVIVIEPSAMPQEAPQHLCADAGYASKQAQQDIEVQAIVLLSACGPRKATPRRNSLTTVHVIGLCAIVSLIVSASY